MKSYNEFKIDMAQLEMQMVEANKLKRTEALKKVRELCKKFGFIARYLKGVLAEGRK